MISGIVEIAMAKCLLSVVVYHLHVCINGDIIVKKV